MLSIIILNYKNPPLLRLCLKSLQRCLKSDFEKEIIVVDSESTPETRLVVTEEFPEVKLLIFRENTGYTRGINEGFKISSGEFILILNPDVISLAGSIEKLTEFMNENPKIGLIGPKLLNFDSTPQDSCFRFYTPMTILYRRILPGLPFVKNSLNRFLLKDKDKNKILPVDWLMGSAMMISRSALDKVGVMDERFFNYMSDVDWARRFWENGYQVIYYPLVAMYHYHQRSSKRFSIFDPILNSLTRCHIQDAFKYFRKHGFV